MFLRGLSGVGDYQAAMHDSTSAAAPTPFIAGRSMVEDAASLAREFGDDAPYAASLRAARSRARDNALDWCHWREVGRLVGWLSGEGVDGIDAATRH